ncbi:ABC transporter ATP-binding protein [Chitinophaga pollutisoli]|uniref:ABC transporter ATP-binding protein n=1 Tax=Chitinophaga pollutisoli TaxID=3133966 RepID=A0ABZ2YS43_9BACT
MEKNIVKIENLSHRYGGPWAIRNINLVVNRVGVVGLLGANGAGKSTTMNILCGALRQTEGNVFIDGIDMAKHPVEAKKRIGFLPQVAPLHLDLTVDEYLIYCAQLRDIHPKKVQGALADVKERCGIGHFSKRLIGNLSGGYRQRVGIAQAIIHQPKLVVMDEPTNGLDPNQILEVRALIKDIAQERAVIVSTHILSEVQVLCREIKMVDAGKIVFSDTIEAFNNYIAPHSVLMRLDAPPPEEKLLAMPGVSRVEFLTGQRVRVYFNAEQYNANILTDHLIQASVRENWQLREFGPDKLALDEIFAHLSNYKK